MRLVVIYILMSDDDESLRPPAAKAGHSFTNGIATKWRIEV